MKIFNIRKMTIPLFLLVLLFGCDKIQSMLSNSAPSVHGMVLGMNCEDGNRVLAEKSGLKETYKYKSKNGFTSHNDDYNSELLGWVLNCDEDNKVTRISLSRFVVDKIFNSSGLTPEQFGKEFLAAYNIDQMQPFQEAGLFGGSQGWEKNYKDGSRVRIYSSKSLVVEKLKQRKFK